MSPSGAGHRVEYLISTVSELGAVAPAASLAPLLSAAEHSAAARFRHARDREAYAGAHVLFRLMAARWLGTAPGQAAELELRRHCRSCGGPHGKPEIDGVELSLSRSADAVLIAAAPPGTAVGADLEQIPEELFAGFDDFTLAPAERKSLPCPDIPGRIRLWVAKEAALKATGHGLAVDPQTLSIHERNTLQARTLTASSVTAWTAVVRCATTAELDGTGIAWPPAPEGYAAALASAGTPAIDRLEIADLLPVRIGAG